MRDGELVSARAQHPHRQRPVGWHSPALRIVAGLAARFDGGRLRIVAPDGSERWFGDERGELEATLVIRDPRVVYRFLRGGALGFAEAYIDGDVETPDLEALLRLFVSNYEALTHRWRAASWLGWVNRLWHRSRANTKRGSRRNIYAHYDVGNDFYRLWLDPSMTYSAALFDGTEDLQTAQLAKYRRLAAEVGLGPDRHVLEIGCGWGGFAVVAAREFGCRVTALTISGEQYTYARARVAKAGLDDRIEVRLQDYRDVTGRFDAIVSIEMIEAVGEAYWPVYFDKLRSVLKTGGRCGLQVITIDDRYFDEYRRGVDFIQRYVFPGGMLPSPRTLDAAAANAGLECVGRHRFGRDYARTLEQWAARFERVQSQLSALGYSERFRRLWSYYLAYCEAGFRVGTIDVEQAVFTRAA